MRTGRQFNLDRISRVAFVVAFYVFGSTHVNAEILPQHTLPRVDRSVPANQVTPPAMAPSAAVQPDIDVNVSNLMGNESEVSIDVNPTNANNRVIVGHAPDFNTMNTFFTLDGGQTWTLVALGNMQDGLTSTFRFDPTVAFDDNGNVYVAYGVRTAVPGGGGATQRTIVVCRSTNGGQTYPQCTQVATTIDIDTDGDGIANDLPGNDKWHLATGPDPVTPTQQNVYIAWTQNVTEGTNIDQRIVVSRSIDGGATFSVPVIVADDAISGIDRGLFADPAVGPNGELYVAWHDFGDNQILVDVSLDGGVTFGTDSLVTNIGFSGLTEQIPPQPDREVPVGPTIDVDRSGGPFNGRLYVAYTDVAAGGLPDTDVFVRFSDNMGTTWSARTRVNDDGGTNSQFLPWLDVDQQTGLVAVVWYDARNDTNNQQVEVFVALSDNGGANFLSNILVSDGRSDQSTNNPSRTSNNFLEYIGVAVLGCQAFPVWADNSTNLADLDYFTDQVQVTGLDTPLCKTTRTVCSLLGNDPRPSLLDQDIFTFAGTAGEQVTVRVEQAPAGMHTGERVTLILSDAIKGTVLGQIDNSTLPNEISVTLPATGTYLITIAEQPLLAPGERFRGDYCLTVESSGAAAQTLVPTAWVE